MVSRTVIWGLLLSTAVVVSPARAEDATANASTATSESWIKKNGKASYLAWFSGMHTESLAGNRKDNTGAPSGTNVEIDHYLALGASLGKGFTLKVTNWAAQVIDEDDTSRQFEPGDPYMTLSQSQILHSDRYAANLEGYLRYYFPFSRTTSDGLNRGAVRDYGRGMLRLFLNPSKSFMDGKLSFNFAVITNFRFNALTPQERFDRSTRQKALTGKGTPSSQREDMYMILDPQVTYSLSPKVDIYLEWASGYLRHLKSGVVTDASGTHAVDGSWSSITPSDPGAAKTDGHYVSYGVYWSPTKKVYVNPYLSYQLSNKEFDRRLDLFHADVGLQLQYTFM